MDHTITGPAAFAKTFNVSRESLEYLKIYEKLLRKWQKAYNLVASASLDQIWHRHFADSAQLLACAPQARVWLDLGSGAGFPALVLAIMAGPQSGKEFHLLESTGRKCAFLETVVRETGAPARIHNSRIETFDRLSTTVPDIVSARALAPLERLISLAFPLMGRDTILIFQKGRDVDNELKAAARSWNFEVESKPSLTEPDGRILMITNPVALTTNDRWPTN